MSFPLSFIRLLLLLWPMLASAQTCQTATIQSTTPTSRFINHGNGTVSDQQTGLMWKRCSEGQNGTDCSTGSAQTFNWQAALQQAQTVNSNGGFADYNDWRLPNIKELRSIVEIQCIDPAINLGVFINTPSVVFWSSSTYADGSYEAWVFNFSYAHDSSDNKYYNRYVRLVRSGQ